MSTAAVAVSPLIDAHTDDSSVHDARTRKMPKYEFTLVLKGSLGLTEEIADELFEAGCNDGTPGTCKGVFSIDFHREAESLESAINSAINNVKSAGYDVDHVQIEAGAIPQPA